VKYVKSGYLSKMITLLSRALLIAAALTVPVTLCAQTKQSYPSHLVRIQAEVPVQFGLGYEARLSKRFSAQFELGLLTEPNTSLILSTLEALGTDQSVVLMVEDAFQSGIVFEAGGRYNFRKYYTGVFAQLLLLTGKDTPNDLVESAMGVDLSDYPTRPNRNRTTETTLQLNSNLVQVGVMIGRRFPFKNGRTEFDVEFGFSKNIYSSSSISSETRNYETLSTAVDTYLADIYTDYAYVPSLTLALCHRIGK